MNTINTLKKLYTKLKKSYDNWWEEYETALQSLPEDVRNDMIFNQFNIMNK